MYNETLVDIEYLRVLMSCQINKDLLLLLLFPFKATFFRVNRIIAILDPDYA